MHVACIKCCTLRPKQGGIGNLRLVAEGGSCYNLPALLWHQQCSLYARLVKPVLKCWLHSDRQEKRTGVAASAGSSSCPLHSSPQACTQVLLSVGSHGKKEQLQVKRRIKVNKEKPNLSERERRHIQRGWRRMGWTRNKTVGPNLCAQFLFVFVQIYMQINNPLLS